VTPLYLALVTPLVLYFFSEAVRPFFLFPRTLTRSAAQ
jgi:hypothetical protein